LFRCLASTPVPFDGIGMPGSCPSDNLSPFPPYFPFFLPQFSTFQLADIVPNIHLSAMTVPLCRLPNPTTLRPFPPHALLAIFFYGTSPRPLPATSSYLIPPQASLFTLFFRMLHVHLIFFYTQFFLLRMLSSSESFKPSWLTSCLALFIKGYFRSFFRIAGVSCSFHPRSPTWKPTKKKSLFSCFQSIVRVFSFSPFPAVVPAQLDCSYRHCQVSQVQKKVPNGPPTDRAPPPLSWRLARSALSSQRVTGYPALPFYWIGIARPFPGRPSIRVLLCVMIR